MLFYLALPPVPPAIAITLPPKSVTGRISTGTISAFGKPTKTSTQSNGNNNPALQPLACPLPQELTQKSNIVSKLLEKMLATSKQTKGQTIACSSQKKQSVILSFQTQIHKHKQAKGFSPSVSQSQANANSDAIPAANTSGVGKSVTASATTNADVNSKEQQQSQTLTNNFRSEKADDKNAIGKILATVQELISVSLYASINNNITDVIQPNKQNVQEIATTVSTEAGDNKKPGKNTNSNSNQEVATNKNIGAAKILEVIQELISVSLAASLNNSINDAIKPNTENADKIAIYTPEVVNSTEDKNHSANLDSNNNQKLAANNNTNQPDNSSSTSVMDKLTRKPTMQLARAPGEPFLVSVVINGREVGTIDIIQEDDTLFVPLETFAEVAGFTVEITDNTIQVKTPLGVVKLQPNSWKRLKGVVYISKARLQKELSINIDLNTADLSLLADLPWRGGSRQSRPDIELKPEFFAPGSGLSNFKQELNIATGSGNTDFRSSSLIGGRIGGLGYRLRVDNNFVNQPDLSEYFLYKRSGQFVYQAGRQQVGLHPLLNSLDLTGFQFGYSNLPPDRFSSNYGANELLSRNYRPIQSFRGQVPPASFVQLRVAGIIVAQQQVGFNGLYEFIDVNLPTGQSNEIEVLIYDRNNLRVPLQIRSIRMNASDLLLPPGGNVQLAGLGFSGNLAQKTLFGDNTNSSYEGKPVGFYQLRQGLSNNLTFEGSVQAVPDVVQSQAGLVWRLANPIVLSASVGNSGDKLGYTAGLDVQLGRLEINANSQSLPQGFRTGREFKNQSQYNHNFELKYRFSNNFDLGLIARSRQDETASANYILPTFSARPFSTVSLSGRPDIEGRYLFNAFYQPNSFTRLSFNTYGDAYISDLSYKFANDYQVSFGNEFGGNSASRYTLSLGRSPNSLRELSWNLGVAFRDGEVAPTAGASMQVLPGLLARLDYQGIPSRARGTFGGFGDDRLTLSLVSDLSFAGGRVAPASYTGISKQTGAIVGKLVLQGKGKGFDLSGSNIRVYDKQNQTVGGAKTDSSGNFFVGNLPEGVYVVELEPEELPVELSVPKTSLVAEVAASGVTKLDFPVRAEFGLAGRVTDVSGQPIEQVRIELINSTGIRALSTITDQYGLYRLDGVPVGKYTLRVSPQDALNPTDTLPKRQIEISNQFVYDQNLQLPISSAAKKK